MQNVAQAWLIYRLSHSPLLLGLDPVLGTAPIFLLSLFGGVAADRVERRYLLMGSQYLQMACALALAILSWLGMIQVWHMLTCSFISGFAQAFGGPAYSALIPTLVKKEDMPNAIALNSIQFNAATMVGPAIAAGVLATLGQTWCFALNAASFLAPIISLHMLTARFLPVRTGETILEGVKQGIRFIRGTGAMALLIILAFATTFLAVPSRTFLPIFANDIFKSGPSTYAMFVSLYGAGSIVGALGIAAFSNAATKGRSTLMGMLVLGGAIAVFGVSKTMAVSSVALVVSGASMMAVFASVNSLVQLIVTNEMRGRIMSVYNLAFRGGMMMGNLAAGSLVPVISAPLTLAGNGLALVVLVCYFLLAQRRVAEL